MKKLNLREGDYINILSSKNLDTIFGNIPRSLIKSNRFFDTGMYEYDSSIDLHSAESNAEFLNVPNSFDFYEIHLDNFDDLDTWKTKINNLSQIPIVLLIGDNLTLSLFNALEVEKNVMFLILLLIIIVAVFNLISSMIILVSMKRLDIGVLRMLG